MDAVMAGTNPAPEASSAQTVASNPTPDAASLAQQRRNLQREKSMLLERIQVQKLQEDVQRLRRHTDGSAPLADEIINTMAMEDVPYPPSKSASQTRSKRTRTDATPSEDDDETTSQRRRLTDIPFRFKAEKPEKYDSQSQRRFKEYIRHCETAFQMGQTMYPDDKTKICYASQFLTGETLDGWLRHESQMGEDEQAIWEEYNGVLKDLLLDPVTRSTMLALRYDRAQQRKGQTVRQFVSYLEELEMEFDYTETQRRQHLYAKLRPEIRRALSNYQTLPDTRQGLMQLAIQLESNQLQESKPEPKPGERSSNAGSTTDTRKPKENKGSPKKNPRTGRHVEKSRQTSSTSRQPTDALTQAEREHRDKNNLCYRCGKPGHLARQCWAKLDRKTTPEPKNSKGQQSEPSRRQASA